MIVRNKKGEAAKNVNMIKRNLKIYDKDCSLSLDIYNFLKSTNYSPSPNPFVKTMKMGNFNKISKFEKICEKQDKL